MAIEMKQRADDTVYALTAENVMDRNCLIIPQQIPVGEAAHLLHRKRPHVAAVVDENGRCAGMLRAADVFRWIEADCPKAVVGTHVTLSTSSKRPLAQRRRSGDLHSLTWELRVSV